MNTTLDAMGAPLLLATLSAFAQAPPAAESGVTVDGREQVSDDQYAP